ncbi:MAG: hypothetical protein JO157_02805 [Acetobacteraceae bacterium]|nr:hypothetical protein [Acetobacteraceae bacterium]
MVLNLLPATEVEHYQEIRLLPGEPPPFPPALGEWSSDIARQRITHAASGCQFHAYPVPPRMVEGLVTPFAPPYEIAVRFVGMADATPCPSPETVRELGRQGIAWILKFTAEARRA